MDLLDFELWKRERTITLFLKLFIHLFAITDLDSSTSGTNLVKKAIYAMVEGDCDEVRYMPHFATRGLFNPFTHLFFFKLYFNTCFVPTCPGFIMPDSGTHSQALSQRHFIHIVNIGSRLEGSCAIY